MASRRTASCASVASLRRASCSARAWSCEKRAHERNAGAISPCRKLWMARFIRARSRFRSETISSQRPHTLRRPPFRSRSATRAMRLWIRACSMAWSCASSWRHLSSCAACSRRFSLSTVERQLRNAEPLSPWRSWPTTLRTSWRMRLISTRNSVHRASVLQSAPLSHRRRTRSKMTSVFFANATASRHSLKAGSTRLCSICWIVFVASARNCRRSPQNSAQRRNAEFRPDWSHRRRTVSRMPCIRASSARAASAVLCSASRASTKAVHCRNALPSNPCISWPTTFFTNALTRCRSATNSRHDR